jgi:hypothetical protein
LEVLASNSKGGWFADGINEVGQVSVLRSRGSGDIESFVFDDERGLVRMRRGLKRSARRKLMIIDFNDRGVFFGAYAGRRGCVPVVFDLDNGWTRLSPLDARVRNACSGTINNSGDLTFVIAQPPDEDTHPYARRTSFLLPAGEELVELGDLGLPVTAIGAVNKRGWVAGWSVNREKRPLAYLYRSGRDLQAIHPEGFESSAALFINSKGLVAGVARTPSSTSRSTTDTVFTYHRKKGHTVMAAREEFEVLLRRLGVDSNSINVELNGLNRRGEIIGALTPEGAQGTGMIAFLIAPSGLFSLQEIVDASGRSDLKVVSRPLGINDKGQIAVFVERPDSSGAITTAVLTPVH